MCNSRTFAPAPQASTALCTPANFGKISQLSPSGSSSVVESRLPKPLVAGSIPVSRSILIADSILVP